VPICTLRIAGWKRGKERTREKIFKIIIIFGNIA
jgi:hypothetical protein